MIRYQGHSYHSAICRDWCIIAEIRYKNGGLLKRDWLVGQLYPPPSIMITYHEVIDIHNNKSNNDESIIEGEEKSRANVDMDSD